LSEALPALPFLQAPFPHVITAGQPSGAQLQALALRGFHTIINVRGHGEPGVAEAPGFVAGLGMRYVHIPVSGPDDLTVENAQQLADALASADALPALVFCGSANRVGALFAVKARFLDGKSVDEALAEGRASGLLGLEPYVRMLLSQA